jgi:hypothetical protein
MHSVALRAGVFHVVEREAKAAKEAAKAELSGLLMAGDTVAGRVGDEILCKASWSKGSARVVVTDEKAFTAWVKEKHPTEIVEKVNEAYVKSLKQIDGVLVDAAGEIAPGIEVKVGDPSLSVRAEKGALELVDKLIAEGRVSLGGIKELVTEAETVVVVEGEVVEGSDV